MTTSFAAEVIVVGGGPGGSATAALLADAGHDVVLLDKAGFPRHKACSEYCNPEGARILRDLGVEESVLAEGPHRMEAMRTFAPGGRWFRTDFEAAESGRAALGLSRHKLDHLLLQRAAAAGARVCQRAHVRSVVVENGRPVGVTATIGGMAETLRAPLIVGADGRHSAVRRELGLDVPIRWPRSTGLVAHYRGVVGLERWGEMHVARHGYAGLAPLEDGLTNVAFVADATGVEGREGSLADFFETGLAAIPEVASKLAKAERVGGIRGVGPMAFRARRTAGYGYLLVGDAASFLDPFTGDGIYEALRGAQLAAPVINAALKAGDPSDRALAPYRAARRRVFTNKRAVCWIVQGFVHTPVLMDYVADRLDRRPDLARTLAGVMGNFRPARQAMSPLFLARLLRP